MISNSFFISLLKRIAELPAIFLGMLDRSIGVIYTNSVVKKLFGSLRCGLVNEIRIISDNAVIFKKIKSIGLMALYGYSHFVADFISQVYENSVFMDKLERAIRNSWCIRSRS